MKLIIDIPEEIMEYIKNNGCLSVIYNDEVAKAIINGTPYEERPQGEWGKWVISEIQCPNCLEYFLTDCYSIEELKKCPNCKAKMF